MDENWRILARVRELRVRLTLNEVAQRRQTLERVQATLQEARLHQSQLERRVAEASDLLAGCSAGVFIAAHAHDLLTYAAGLRVQAQEAATPVRRAQLQYERARAAASEAGAKFRQEAARRDVIDSQWQAWSRTCQQRELEREDEMRAEERAGVRIAQCLTQT